MSERAEREVPFTLQLALISAVVIFQLLWLGLPGVRTSLLDTDDAMRLVEVREYLSGRDWFDMHEPRVAPPQGYDTHWSRLVDAGLAGLHGVFAPFTSPANAEFLMRVTWPLIWLIVALAGIMAASLRLAGEKGLFASGFLAALNTPAYIQFGPGRIDHHNVQIALSVLVLAGVVWSDRNRWAAAGAGACAALAMAVGLESLPFLAIAAAALVLRFLVEPGRGRELSHFCWAFSITLAAAYLGTVPFARFSETACDALASNLAMPLVPGSLALAVVSGFERLCTPARRLAAVAALGLAVLAAILFLEPRCLSGPFAMLETAARDQWLVNVKESQPLFAFLGSPIFAMTAVPLLVTALIVLLLLRDRSQWRNFAFQTTFTLFAAAMAMGFVNTKMTIYAFWFALPLLALAVTKLWSRFNISRAVSKVGVVIAIAPFLSSMLALAVTTAMADRKGSFDNGRLCNLKSDYRLLSGLAPGLVITDVDTGAYMLALTRHSVLAAPYHRLGPQIIQNMRILSLPPEEAKQQVIGLGAAYVAICRARHAQRPGFRNRNWNMSLTDNLLGGTPPSWLEPVMGDAGGFVVYRVAAGAATTTSPSSSEAQ